MEYETAPPPTPDRWGGIWRSTLGDPAWRELSARAMSVYMLLTTYATVNAYKGSCTYRVAWPSLDRMADDLGVSEGTVRRALSELRRTGWVAARKRRGTSEYEVRMHPGEPDRRCKGAATKDAA